MNGASKSRRMCVFIPVDGFVEGHGWRVSIVTEGEPGHCPTGTWPYTGAANETAPWFWGKTRDDYDFVCKVADDANAKRGYTKAEVSEIICSSMWARRPRSRRRSGS